MIQPTPCAIGQAAPAFTAPATGDAGEISLAALRGKNVVLYFYPKDSTPGCTTEASDFTALLPAFAAANTVVLGISRDSLKSHEGFCAKIGIGFPLLSDPDETLCKAYAVMQEKTQYGRTYLGLERSTFLIDPMGILRREWRKVKVAGHAQAVLEAAQGRALIAPLTA
jgi:peroxiredoxin Q/BCP